MNNAELRSEPRVRVSFRGTLRLGDTTVPCHIQNMCSRGFLIKSAEELPVGRVLHLTCELYPGRRVECAVQVRHVNRDCIGAKVTAMSELDQVLCRQFLEEQKLANLAGPRAAPRPAA
jgi:hypothetical protein